MRPLIATNRCQLTQDAAADTERPQVAALAQADKEDEELNDEAVLQKPWWSADGLGREEVRSYYCNTVILSCCSWLRSIGNR